jgi:hypothetical protein
MGMSRSIAEIGTDIKAAAERSASLQAELRNAQLDASRATFAEMRRRKAMDAVVARLRSGQWASGHGARLFWHSETQTMIAHVTVDDREALETLSKSGVVEHGARRSLSA